MPGRHASHRSRLLQRPYHQPTEVELVAPHAHARRGGERVVVIVKPFAKRQDAEEPDVGSALLGPGNDEAVLAPGMCRVADEPVTENARRRARADADRHGSRAKDEEDADGERKDVERPGTLEEPEPRITQDVRGEPAVGSLVRRLEAQVEVPYEVARDRVIVRKVAWTVGHVLAEDEEGIERRPRH